MVFNVRMTIAFAQEDGVDFSVHVKLYKDMKTIVIYKGVSHHVEERKWNLAAKFLP